MLVTARAGIAYSTSPACGVEELHLLYGELWIVRPGNSIPGLQTGRNPALTDQTRVERGRVARAFSLPSPRRLAALTLRNWMAAYRIRDGARPLNRCRRRRP